MTGVVVVNEALKTHLEHYLKKHIDLKQEYIDEAMKTVKLCYIDATIDRKTMEPNVEPEKPLEDKKVYHNRNDFQETKTHTPTVSVTNTSEEWITKTSGWSVTGTLGAAYQGAKASSNVGYHRGKSKTKKKSHVVAVTAPLSETFEVPAHSSRAACLVEQTTSYNVDVKGVLLTFQRDVEIRYGRLPHKKTKLSNILNSNSLPGSSDINANINGKFIASDTKKFVQVYPSTN